MAKFVEIFFEIMATNILRYETIGSYQNPTDSSLGTFINKAS